MPLLLLLNGLILPRTRETAVAGAWAGGATKLDVPGPQVLAGYAAVVSIVVAVCSSGAAGDVRAVAAGVVVGRTKKESDRGPACE